MPKQLSLFEEFENLSKKGKSKNSGNFRRKEGEIWKRKDGTYTRVRGEIVKLIEYDLTNKNKFDEVLLKIKYDNLKKNYKQMSPEEFEMKTNEIEQLHEKIKSKKMKIHSEGVVLERPKQKIEQVSKEAKILHNKNVSKLKKQNKDYIVGLVKRIGIVTGNIYQFKQTFNSMLKNDLKVGLTIDDFSEREIEGYYHFLRRRVYGK